MSIFSTETPKEPKAGDPQTAAPRNPEQPQEPNTSTEPAPEPQAIAQPAASGEITTPAAVQAPGEGGEGGKRGQRGRSSATTADRLKKLSREQLDRRVADAIKNLEEVLAEATKDCERLKEEAGQAANPNGGELGDTEAFTRTSTRLGRAYGRVVESVHLRREMERTRIARQSRGVLDYVLASSALSPDKVEAAMALMKSGEGGDKVLAALLGASKETA